MICKFCGSQNDDDNFICDNCGKPFDDELDLEALKDHRPKTISFDDEIVEPIFESQKQAAAQGQNAPMNPIPQRTEEAKNDFPPISVDEVPESFKAVLYNNSDHNRTEPEKVRTVQYDDNDYHSDDVVARRPLFNEEDLEPDEDEAKRQELRVMNNFKKCTVCGALIKDGGNKSMCTDCFNAKIESMVSSGNKEEKGKHKIKMVTAIAASVLIVLLIVFVVLMFMASSGTRKEQNRDDYDALQSAIREDERRESQSQNKNNANEEEKEDVQSNSQLPSDSIVSKTDDNAGDIFNKIQGGDEGTAE